MSSKWKRKYLVKKTTSAGGEDGKREIRGNIFHVIKWVWKMYPVDKIEIHLSGDEDNG